MTVTLVPAATTPGMPGATVSVAGGGGVPCRPPCAYACVAQSAQRITMAIFIARLLTRCPCDGKRLTVNGKRLIRHLPLCEYASFVRELDRRAVMHHHARLDEIDDVLD